ncbi:MAG: hypothetical protein ACREOE_12225 [Gemmatimonadales bacterium]
MQNDQHTTPTNAPTDVGAATSPPSWCLPDAEPQWDRLSEQHGGGDVVTWSRDISDDVWIEAEDRIIDGRVMRGQSRISYSEAPAEGLKPAAARRIARALITAADLITDSWLDDEGNV